MQASHVRRVLEIGGRLGDSAYNFVQGLHRKNGSRVYSVDTARVPRVYGTTANHTPIQKDARALVLADVDNEPIDLLFLDCHDFLATRASLTRLLDKQMLSREAYVVLHDTGLHSRKSNPTLKYERLPNGKWVHQPVERLIADWLLLQNTADRGEIRRPGWQRISVHDDERRPYRHGLTIMQRLISLEVSRVSCEQHTRDADLCAQLRGVGAPAET